MKLGLLSKGGSVDNKEMIGYILTGVILVFAALGAVALLLALPGLVPFLIIVGVIAFCKTNKLDKKD